MAKSISNVESVSPLLLKKHHNCLKPIKLFHLLNKLYLCNTGVSFIPNKASSAGSKRKISSLSPIPLTCSGGGGTDLSACLDNVAEKLNSPAWKDADAVVISDFVAQR